MQELGKINSKSMFGVYAGKLLCKSVVRDGSKLTVEFSINEQGWNYMLRPDGKYDIALATLDDEGKPLDSPKPLYDSF